MQDQGSGMIGHYQNVEDLGVGGYSRVVLAIDTRSKVYVAVKILLSEPKKVTNPSTNQTTMQWVISDSKVKQCKREIKLMQQIAHKNVVALHDVIEDATFPQKADKNDPKSEKVQTPCLCVVLEYCSRGELFDFLMYTGRLGERATRTYFIQFLDGLKAMHDSGYAHRDLKPENLLLSDDFTLKIADFGFATEFKDNKGKIKMATTCGTKGYLAPELLSGQKYTHKVDLFAVGIIMFTTFAGFPPFQHAGSGDWWWDKMSKAWTYWTEAPKAKNDIEREERYKKGVDKMKLFWAAHERSLPFEDKFKDLMQNLLNPYPGQRYDIADCFKHPWMKGKTYSAKQMKKYMTKFVNTVSAQRAIKIKKQLADQGMDSQAGKARAKRALVDSNQKEKLEKMTTEFQAKLGDINENTALLNKVRFKFESTETLVDIITALDIAARLAQAEIDMDVKKCELTISASITRQIKKENTATEDVTIKVKVFKAQWPTFDEDDSGDFIDVDDDIADANDDEKDTSDDANGNPNANAVVDPPANNNANNDKERWAVLFYRIGGSADGFQQLMAQIFYHPLVTAVMDLDQFIPKSDDAVAELTKKMEPARAFIDVFNQQLPAGNPQNDATPVDV